MNDLRTAFGLEHKYKSVGEFRRVVIDGAILELNAADLGFRVEADTDMIGRRARGFILHVSLQKAGELKQADRPTKDEEEDDDYIEAHQEAFDVILKELKADGELFPLAGYSSVFMRELAQRAEALKRLKASNLPKTRGKRAEV